MAEAYDTPPALQRLNSRRVPVLQPGAAGLLKSLSDEDMDFRELARIIERFSSIAARLIALANSAWSAPASPISSVEGACSRLGFGVVRSTGISLAVAAPFNSSRCPGFDPEEFWTHALLGADAASWLCPVSSLQHGLDASTARTAGLLHNLGLLWLADELPAEVDRAISLAGQSPSQSVGHALSELIGIDIAQAGEHLGKTWNLPDQLVTAMGHCTEPQYRGHHWETATLVGVAKALISAMREEAPCPVADGRLKSLGISTSAAEKVFLQLDRQYERTRKLAKTLFNQ